MTINLNAIREQNEAATFHEQFWTSLSTPSVAIGAIEDADTMENLLRCICDALSLDPERLDEDKLICHLKLQKAALADEMFARKAANRRIEELEAERERLRETLQASCELTQQREDELKDELHCVARLDGELQIERQ